MFGSARDEKNVFVEAKEARREENIPHHRHIDFCLFTRKKANRNNKKYKVALNIHRRFDGTKIFFDSLRQKDDCCQYFNKKNSQLSGKIILFSTSKMTREMNESF
jgi:hypothetical protein